MATGRGWLFAALAALAIGGPYLASQDGRRRGAESTARWWDSMWTVDGASSSPLAAIGTAAGDLPARSFATAGTPRVPVTAASPMPLAGSNPVPPPAPPSPTLAEALRFDISPGWVSQRWPQVWTRQSDSDLASVRVTMVSGTRLTDLAGSLTYYFDQHHQLQRIDFDGTCGDPSELIMVVTRSYGLTPMPAVGGYQYLLRGGRQRLTSALRIDNAHHVRQSQPYERYLVTLELRRPGSTGSISPRMLRTLDLPASDKELVDSALKQERTWGPGSSSSSSKKSMQNEQETGRPLETLLPRSG